MTMNLRDTYDRLAEDWHRDHKTDSWWVEGVNYFCSHLQKRARILDAGCGAGSKSKYLANKSFEVTGIDFSQKLIEIARREVPEVDFQVLDMREASMLGMTFGAVFAQASLLHIPRHEIASVLKELASVLERGGLFYIAVKGKRPGGADEQVVTERDYGYEYQRFFSYYTAEELETDLARLNIETIHKIVNRVGETDWIQLIGRKL